MFCEWVFGIVEGLQSSLESWGIQGAHNGSWCRGGWVGGFQKDNYQTSHSWRKRNSQPAPPGAGMGRLSVFLMNTSEVCAQRKNGNCYLGTYCRRYLRPITFCLKKLGDELRPGQRLVPIFNDLSSQSVVYLNHRNERKHGCGQERK